MATKTINSLHLIYIIIIFVIILLALWFVCPYVVCEDTLTKFEFAATITSIVLAVVSIMYSMYSGQGVSQNLGAMRDATATISTVGQDMQHIKENLNNDIESLGRLESEMKNAQSGIIQILQETKNLNQKMTPPEQNSSIPSNNIDGSGSFVFSKTSIIGKCIIYACMLSKEKNKPFPAALLGNPSYVHGYVTALETCAPTHFRANGRPDATIEATFFDNRFFKDITKQGIITEINSNGLYFEMRAIMHNILEYFGENLNS